MATIPHETLPILFELLVGANSCRNIRGWECGKLPRGNLSNSKEGCPGLEFAAFQSSAIRLPMNRLHALLTLALVFVATSLADQVDNGKF
jgi:hypothetical protein